MSEKTLNKGTYVNFLLKSELSSNLISKWYNDELLANAIIKTLVDKNLITYDEVISNFNDLAKSKLYDIINPDTLDNASIPLNLNFSSTEQELNSKCELIKASDAIIEFSILIESVIPKALIVKYISSNSLSDSEDEFKALLKNMSSCTELNKMFDLYITSEPLVQKALVTKLVNFLNLLESFKDQQILFPKTQIGILRLFLKESITAEDLTRQEN